MRSPMTLLNTGCRGGVRGPFEFSAAEPQKELLSLNLCPFLIIGKIPSLATIQQLGFVLGLCYFFRVLFPR